MSQVVTNPSAKQPLKKWELARRDLLKGLGVGMGMLPLLRASDVWGADLRPKRLIISCPPTAGASSSGSRRWGR